MISDIVHVYLAHPYGGEEANLEAAEELYAILSHLFPEHVFVADWIHHCRAYSDSDENDRSLGMLRNMAQIERCDELWAAGFDEVIISPGMEEEIFFAKTEGKIVRHATAITTPLSPSAKKAKIKIEPPLEEDETDEAPKMAN